MSLFDAIIGGIKSRRPLHFKFTQSPRYLGDGGSAVVFDVRY